MFWEPMKKNWFDQNLRWEHAEWIKHALLIYPWISVLCIYFCVHVFKFASAMFSSF